jgi:hypothetical protein
MVKIISAAAEVMEDRCEHLRRKIQLEVVDLCQDPTQTALRPLCAANHIIPIIDPKKVYSWRPSKCPEALKPTWQTKEEVYLNLVDGE